MLTNEDGTPHEDDAHRIGILGASTDLWGRLKVDRPELCEPGALQPVILKCSKRHNIMVVRLIGWETSVTPPVEFDTPGFEVVHVFDDSAVLTANSLPNAEPEAEGVIDPETGDMVTVPAQPRNELSAERVTIQCPMCRAKKPGHNIVVKADTLLLQYAGALAAGKQSAVIG